MNSYTVSELAKIAGISNRTIRYYDNIGLLNPSERTDSGYRLYQRKELVKLQQILLYREMEISLKDIKEVINNPAFNTVRALEQHRFALKRQISHLRTLIKTVEKTMKDVKTKDAVMTDQEIYEGFTKEETANIRKEVSAKSLKRTEQRIKDLGRQGWHETKKKGVEIEQMLAELMVHEPTHLLVQKTIALHHRHLETFYKVSEERYRGLAKMYVEDERFKQHYDNYRPGLAEFVRQSIGVFCDNKLQAI